jgi:hypothetical protein
MFYMKLFLTNNCRFLKHAILQNLIASRALMFTDIEEIKMFAISQRTSQFIKLGLRNNYTQYAISITFIRA